MSTGLGVLSLDLRIVDGSTPCHKPTFDQPNRGPQEFEEGSDGGWRVTETTSSAGTPGGVCQYVRRPTFTVAE